MDPLGLELKIAGSISFRKDVQEALKKIDPSIKVNLFTGQVTQDSNINIKGHKNGNELLSRMISNPNKLTIHDSRSKWQLRKIKALDPNYDQSLYKGSNFARSLNKNNAQKKDLV